MQGRDLSLELAIIKQLMNQLEVSQGCLAFACFV